MCGAVRRIWDLLSVELHEGVELAERFADGSATEAECMAATERLLPHEEAEGEIDYEISADYALNAAGAAIVVRYTTRLRAVMCCWSVIEARARWEAEHTQQFSFDATHQATEMAEEQAVAAVVREVFGNPFRSAHFNSAWRTDTVLAVARRAYDAREFGALPILADALQDAGCDSADLLDHLRDPHAEHVRGCWALDLVLGNE